MREAEAGGGGGKRLGIWDGSSFEMGGDGGTDRTDRSVVSEESIHLGGGMMGGTAGGVECRRARYLRRSSVVAAAACCGCGAW